MKILFLHGWHSSPGGRKPTFLTERGHQVLNPSLCPDDFQKAISSAQNAFDQGQPDLVVGSSRGGACAMNLEIDQTPMVLVCPAWKHWGTAKTVKQGTLILHSPQDEAVDFENSLELVEKSGLPADSLIRVGREHRMACLESLNALADACESFLPEKTNESTPGPEAPGPVEI
jgi:hypothetical protein